MRAGYQPRIFCPRVTCRADTADALPVPPARKMLCRSRFREEEFVIFLWLSEMMLCPCSGRAGGDWAPLGQSANDRPLPAYARTLAAGPRVSLCLDAGPYRPCYPQGVWGFRGRIKKAFASLQLVAGLPLSSLRSPCVKVTSPFRHRRRPPRSYAVLCQSCSESGCAGGI